MDPSRDAPAFICSAISSQVEEKTDNAFFHGRYHSIKLPLIVNEAIMGFFDQDARNELRRIPFRAQQARRFQFKDPNG
jgi:hypothetical protein